MRSSANLRVARLYAAGSAALGSWFWLLLWPAASLALIAIAYARGNSSVFRKSSGRLPISTRVVLGPYLVGALARLWIYRRRGEPWVEAAPGVYCGRLLTKREALAMRAMGVTGVLDVTAEHAETREFLEIVYLNPTARSLQELAYLNATARSLQKIEYLNVPVLDLTEPSREQLDIAVAFIAEHARRGGVYVHCALGVSRSVAAAAAYIASQQTEPTAPMCSSETLVYKLWTPFRMQDNGYYLTFKWLPNPSCPSNLGRCKYSSGTITFRSFVGSGEYVEW